MSRSVPDPIQWHEGLLLTPQHFQQQALRVDTLLQDLPGRYWPFYWGLRASTFEFDTTDFTIGILNVRRLEAVMPDGYFVVASAQDQLQLDLRPFAAALRQRPMLVYLAMPLRGDTPVANQRFVSYEGEACVDENTGDGAVVIPRLRPRLSLIATGEPPPSRYTSFPLIEVACEGQTFLATEFVPPTLAVPGGSPLGRVCAGVSEHLRRKAAKLAESAIVAPQGAFASESRSQLRALVGALPPLEALLHTDAAHPFTLYLELCRLAGEVSLLGDSLVPPVFAAYNHNDARRSFDEVSRFIHRSVNEGLPDTVKRFAFKDDDDMFALEADAAWSNAFAFDSRAKLVLGLRFEGREADAIEWGENCVIGSRSLIPSLLSRRVLGVPRAYAERVGELLPPRGVYLFELTPSPGEVLTVEDLVVFGGGASSARPEAIFLYVFEPVGEPEGV